MVWRLRVKQLKQRLLKVVVMQVIQLLRCYFVEGGLLAQYADNKGMPRLHRLRSLRMFF